MKAKQVQSWRPSCPNHGATLEGVPFPLPTKGTGICPVSGAHFSFEASAQEGKMVKDKDGRLQKSKVWDMVGSEVE